MRIFKTVFSVLFVFLFLISATCISNATVKMNPMAEISVVGIDADTLYHMGNDSRNGVMYQGDFPIPKVWYANTISMLRQSNVQLIAIDYVFQYYPTMNKNDEVLADAVAVGPPPVIFGFDIIPRAYNNSQEINLRPFALPNVSASIDAYDAPALALPYKMLIDSHGYLASIHDVVDQDGVVRRCPLFVKYNGVVFPTMPLVAFMKTAGIGEHEISVSGGAMIVRGVKFPLAAGGSIQVDFPEQRKLFKRYSFKQITYIKDEYKKGAVNNHMEWLEEEFRGDIIFIGPTDVSLNDYVVTPAGGSYPGVEVIAAATNQLLNIWAQSRGISKPVWQPPAQEERPAPVEETPEPETPSIPAKPVGTDSGTDSSIEIVPQ